MTYKNLGIFLKRKRIENGLTQSLLSKKLKGVHVQFISNWERGLCAPPSNRMKTLINLLHIQETELVEIMVEDCRSNIEAKIFGKKFALKSKI